MEEKIFVMEAFTFQEITIILRGIVSEMPACCDIYTVDDISAKLAAIRMLCNEKVCHVDKVGRQNEIITILDN
jgi:hypothetical protein